MDWVGRFVVGELDVSNWLRCACMGLLNSGGRVGLDWRSGCGRALPGGSLAHPIGCGWSRFHLTQIDMKTRISKVAKRAGAGVLAVSTVIFLSGCGSSQSVKTEARSADVEILQDSIFRVEMVAASSEDLDFGPKNQESARSSLEKSLQERGLRIAEGGLAADYVVKFGTFREEDSERIAAVFPETRTRVYSRPRGVTTPLGSVVTGRDSYVVHDTYDNVAVTFEDANRVFVVEVADAKSDELLWRGYTRRGSERLDAARIEEEIGKVVAEIPLAERVERNELALLDQRR